MENCEPKRDHVHLRPSEGPCQIHDWPTAGLARRLLAAMRERHGKGGINACRECIQRAAADVRTMRAAAGGAT